MEGRFLETVEMIATKSMPAKYAADKIKPVDLTDSARIDFFSMLRSREEHLRNIGKEVLSRGELMPIDLVAGMATGFGGIAKAAVKAQLDERYDVGKHITYLDIKRIRYLQLQREHGRHLIAAAMISDATEIDIRENLSSFAKENKVELILIEDGTPANEIQDIWDKNKDRWNECIIVPLIRQPSTLYVSEDGTSVGGEYMKGHGDFFDVIKSQLADIIEITGVKFLFSSNIDNTGGYVSESILGYAVEELQQRQIQAIVEVVEKYEGDKGGVPALVDGKLTILEEPFVPAEWKDEFMGRKTFPYFNTNTFWWDASAILTTKFNLPLMVTKKIEEGENKWMKVESIMGHGLNDLNFKALVVDRGLRFLPAKFLTDLWIGRTDYMHWWQGLLMPAMEDGKYIPKPLVEVSKSVFKSVDELNRAFFGYGIFDHMRHLFTLAIGGEGEYFNELGRMNTNCGVSYVGDVAIVFEKRQDMASGMLSIQGARNSDRISLINSMLFVPAGETLVLKRSVKNFRDPRVTREKLAAFLENMKRWPATQRERILNNFFPPSGKEDEKLVNLPDLFSEDKLSGFTDIAREKALALIEAFDVTGYLLYAVTKIGNDVYLETSEDSMRGSAKQYASRAIDNQVLASDHKSPYLRFGNSILVFTRHGLNCVLIPMENEALLLTGRFKDLAKERKLELFKGKLEFIIKLSEDDESTIIDPNAIREKFMELNWKTLFESESRAIYEIIKAGIE